MKDLWWYRLSKTLNKKCINNSWFGRKVRRILKHSKISGIELALTLRRLWTTSGLEVRHTKTEIKLNENLDHRPHKNLDSPESNTINGFLEKIMPL